VCLWGGGAGWGWGGEAGGVTSRFRNLKEREFRKPRNWSALE
jgi:hypothetical protein